jgi:outer membrane protein assembly factor BamB
MDPTGTRLHLNHRSLLNHIVFLVLHFAAFSLLQPAPSFATLIISEAPKFSAPLVLSNQLIFTWPDATKPKLISINRQTGSKLWEKPLSHPGATLWPAPIDPLLAIQTNLFKLNAAHGELIPHFKTPLPIEEIRQPSSDLLLVKCQSENQLTNVLLEVRLPDWRVAWSHTNVYQLLHANSEHVLVEFGESDLSMLLSFSSLSYPTLPHKNLAVALLAAQDGRVLWRCPISATVISQTAVLAEPYVVLSAMGRLICLSARDGSILKRGQFYPQNAIAHLWREGAGIFSDLGTNLVATVDLPMLSTNIILKNLEFPPVGVSEFVGFIDDVLITRGFHGTTAFDARTGRKLWPDSYPQPRFSPPITDAPWSWEGVHNGFIYISRADSTQHKTFIESVELKTGAKRELYSSPQPNP